MFEQKVLSSNQLPLPDNQRKSTDVVCTIIGALFALAMFIVACVMWNKCIISLIQHDSMITSLGLPGMGRVTLVRAKCSTLRIPTIIQYTIKLTQKSVCVSSCPATFYNA